MNSNSTHQERFSVCSKILEIIFAVIMLMALIVSVVKQRQKKYEDTEQQSLQQLDKKKTTEGEQPAPQAAAPDSQLEPQQHLEPEPPREQLSAQSDQSCCFKILNKADLFLAELPLLSVLALNIVCFSSFEYCLISALGYVVLLFIRLQDFCGIKNIYVKLLLEKFPTLLILSWFINFFVSDLHLYQAGMT